MHRCSVCTRRCVSVGAFCKLVSFSHFSSHFFSPPPPLLLLFFCICVVFVCVCECVCVCALRVLWLVDGCHGFLASPLRFAVVCLARPGYFARCAQCAPSWTRVLGWQPVRGLRALHVVHRVRGVPTRGPRGVLHVHPLLPPKFLTAPLGGKGPPPGGACPAAVAVWPSRPASTPPGGVGRRSHSGPAIVARQG